MLDVKNIWHAGRMDWFRSFSILPNHRYVDALHACHAAVTDQRVIEVSQ